MPIYEYVCPKCKHEIEILQSSYDDPNPKCEKCLEKQKKEEIEMQRKLSKTSFHLKGGGWAKDGYGG